MEEDTRLLLSSTAEGLILSSVKWDWDFHSLYILIIRLIQFSAHRLHKIKDFVF